MSSSAASLHDAILAALTADSYLVGLLGAARVFDQIPQPPPYPYIVLGQTNARDGDADDAPTDEHTVTLQVWSRARGRREVQTIVDAIRTTLHDAALPLVGHRLINLRHEFSEARRDSDGVTFRGLARFRAVTEPL
jgi:hypothetical protein